jgi:SAM-dependent methyltransferase
MPSKQISPQEELMKFILSKWISKPIYVAAKLRIADQLSDGPKPIDELAEAVGAHAPSLYRLMRALACVGIFAQTDDGCFELTPVAACLVSDALRPVALMMHSPWHDRAWDHLLEGVQTGRIAFDAAHGARAFDWFDKHPRAAAVFHQANAVKTMAAVPAIIDAYDFSTIHTLIDIGGGTGALMAGILKTTPGLTGIVADLSSVIHSTEDAIRRSGLTGRGRRVACNMFETVPAGGDAYLLSNVLHDWNDTDALAILAVIHRAIQPGGRLLIVESVVPPDNNFSIAKLLDLEVFVMGGGRERTLAEYRTLLGRAGFRLSKVVATRADVSIIEGIRTAQSPDA